MLRLLTAVALAALTLVAMPTAAGAKTLRGKTAGKPVS